MDCVGVVGAGPAGLTAAYLLCKAGINISIWESDPNYVGGISRTVVYKGYRFDIGGHRFYSKSQEIEDLWSEILPQDMLVCSRLSRIFFRGKFYSYPLDPGEVILNIGKRQSILAVASYLKAKMLIHSEATNFEDWITHKFGGCLYRMFFKSYTEKVWGMPCREISADWAVQRINGFSLGQAARHALLPRPSRQNAGAQRAGEIKTLISSFRYPRLGPGMFWEAAAERVKDLGGSVLMGERVTGATLTRKGTWRLDISQRGQTYHSEVNHLISSIPLGRLIHMLKPSLPPSVLKASEGLRYRNFITVALIIKPRIFFSDNWIYIHDPDLKVGRIQNFGNWSPAMVPELGMACYGMEYFTGDREELWLMTNEELISLATRELEALGLALPGDIKDATVVRQPKAYPVYDENYKRRRLLIRKALEEFCPNLHVVGRNGLHQYNNQDHSMMTGMLTARNILADSQIYDVWQVNQDAEYLEAGSQPIPSDNSSATSH